uniref:Uncharacterized protein n=1 Tax=Anguilla anguilla TaxID=7936 RepID=A0A0E9Q3L9_ANGAN
MEICDLAKSGTFTSQNSDVDQCVLSLSNK